MSSSYSYMARVDRVVDGDTYDVSVDLGFRIYSAKRLRLRGVDTPETWRPKTEAEAKHGAQATEFVKMAIEGQVVRIVTYKASIYNRWEADVYLPDGTNLAEALIANDLLKRDDYPADVPVEE